MLWTQAFWQGAAERAIKTLAQTLVAFFTVGVPIFAIDWREALAVTAAAGVASVLTSIGNADFTAGVTGPPMDLIAWDVDGEAVE